MGIVQQLERVTDSVDGVDVWSDALAAYDENLKEPATSDENPKETSKNRMKMRFRKSGKIRVHRRRTSKAYNQYFYSILI